MNSTAKKQTTRPQTTAPQNGTNAAKTTTAPVIAYEPGNIAEAAEAERYQMVEEFAAFVIAKRLETEKRLFTMRRHTEAVSVFAAAAIADCEELRDLETGAHSVKVPCVVWEYATCALDVEDLEAQLNLLNVFYPEAIRPVSGCELRLDETNSNDVRRLWDWFQAEQQQANEVEASTQ